MMLRRSHRLALEAAASLIQRSAQDASRQLLTAPLLPPIIVTGLPRTGTTFLHRLLAAGSRRCCAPPLLRELLAPVRTQSG